MQVKRKTDSRMIFRRSLEISRQVGMVGIALRVPASSRERAPGLFAAAAGLVAYARASLRSPGVPDPAADSVFSNSELEWSGSNSTSNFFNFSKNIFWKFQKYALRNPRKF